MIKKRGTNRLKEKAPGYYRALRQNRGVLRRATWKLNTEAAYLSGQTNRYTRGADTMADLIERVRTAGVFRRLRYFLSGNVKHLSKAGGK